MHLPVLLATALLVPDPIDPQSAALEEALAFTVEGLYGEAFGFDLKITSWDALREDQGDATDNPVGRAVQDVLALEIGVEQSLQPYVDLAGLVSLLNAHEPSYEWEIDSIHRVVKELGDRSLTGTQRFLAPLADVTSLTRHLIRGTIVPTRFA